MKKLKLYIAISLNGKIAKPDGSVDWLNNIPNPDNSDMGYTDFLNLLTPRFRGIKLTIRLSVGISNFRTMEKRTMFLPEIKKGSIPRT